MKKITTTASIVDEEIIPPAPLPFYGYPGVLLQKCISARKQFSHRSIQFVLCLGALYTSNKVLVATHIYTEETAPSNSSDGKRREPSTKAVQEGCTYLFEAET